MSRSQRRAMIDREEPKLSLVRQCALLGISRSSLYYLPTEAGAEDLELMALIDQQYLDQQYLKTPFYGSRRMTAWLSNHGHQVNRKRVRRLMQLIGLEAIYRRPNTSKPNPGHKVYPYLLRGLEINRVNQVWATDITYIPMARGFLYLVAIMDWHSRYVLAWRLSNTLEVDFCVAALEEALSKGRPQIFNTDQGSQFTSEAFTSMLLAQGVQVSMDGRGRCMDNVFVERLWRSIKYEEVYLKAYQNGTEARKGIGAYLAFYNQERPHQALGYRSPGQVFHAVSPQRCLLEHPQALPSDEGLRDTPAVNSLILASPLSDDGVHLTDHVIDYTQEDFTKGGPHYDLIFDNVENRSLSDCRRALTPSGTLILNSGTGAPWDRNAGSPRQAARFVTVRAPKPTPVSFGAES